ncbi:hypothetical protein SAMN05216600_12041 [Pseudomonas cuatrocienegasensis]|uniref:Lipoprotein n=1 Tax=Pseudomonas cuatrocienegasensis TaxID=543360 RepID=A0ABY1BNT5_9PSED|nr:MULTISPECIES: hypothetical protein [Pseudomonas]OEC34198.1 hypothetical protein A7D25_15040 [Pseudomonas sp. 21C1]SER27213.1 hypothetical protein SAMN05216600_12041 [Pseudomonas cuatrocienegasensis]
MQQILMTLVLLCLLGGCAQPQLDQPKANGSYLVIENDQAWAVLVADGRRTEVHGTVIDAIRLPSQRSAVAASYVIETANCGRVQWLTERADAAEGTTTLMSVHHNAQLDATDCMIRDGISRVWTVLDYSG